MRRADLRTERATVLLCLLGHAFLAAFACRPPQEGALRSSPPPADRHIPYTFVGTKGMVVAAHPLACEAGLRMLESGGNAVDAAVATALALNAAEPFASGIGGGGFMLIFLAKEKKSTVINYRERAPRASRPEMFREKGEEEARWKNATGLAVAVPGALAGWDLALRRYGTRSLAEAAARAIEIADRGFDVSPTFSDLNKEEYEKILTNAGPETCYLNGGLPYEPGERFRNPELAATLRRIATEGIGIFYRGEIAAKIVSAVRTHDGIMTLEDLASYAPEEVPPLRGTYKNYSILTVPPPASGGLLFLELLNICEHWPLKAWGPNSPAYIHHLSEALRVIFADRERFLGDPAFVRVPVEKLLDKSYAARIAARIRPDRCLDGYATGLPNEKSGEPGNTTHLCIVDRHRNIVSLTQSINDFFGSGIIPEGTGFLLNNQMADFSSDPDSPNAPAPGRRPVSSMTPLIVFEKGRPRLALGSPGGTRIFSSLAQIFLNIAEHGFSLDEAIEAPRFFSYSEGGSRRPIAVESRIPKVVLRQLESLGHEVKIRRDYDTYFGGAQGILILESGRTLLGGADSRRDGWGAGY